MVQGASSAGGLIRGEEPLMPLFGKKNLLFQLKLS